MNCKGIPKATVNMAVAGRPRGPNLAVRVSDTKPPRKPPTTPKTPGSPSQNSVHCSHPESLTYKFMFPSTIHGMDPKIPWQIISTKLGYFRNLSIALISVTIVSQTPCCFSSSVRGAAGISGIMRQDNTDPMKAADETAAKEIRHPSVSPKMGIMYSLSATGPTIIPVKVVPKLKKPCMRP